MINPINNLASLHTPTQKSEREERVEELKKVHENTKEKQFVQIMTQVQSSLGLRATEGDTSVQDFKEFLSGIGYEGKPIASLSQDEAAELISEDGFFGVKQTSERIANFVIMGSGGDEEMLREGRKGILQGFDQAEKMWGGKLPDIAYETIAKAVEMIDKALIEGGFSIMDEKV
ncbi:MAG: hypothetical protein COA44_11950 [Arcobacter sp.]|nr:MAG: hypothetical protein COA44_11950 [Arcobacter sp.]